MAIIMVIMVIFTQINHRIYAIYIVVLLQKLLFFTVNFQNFSGGLRPPIPPPGAPPLDPAGGFAPRPPSLAPPVVGGASPPEPPTRALQMKFFSSDMKNFIFYRHDFSW